MDAVPESLPLPLGLPPPDLLHTEVVVTSSSETRERTDSLDSNSSTDVSAKKFRRSSDASAKGAKKARKKSKRCGGKRMMSCKKNEDDDEDATEIEDNDDEDEEIFEWPLSRLPRDRQMPAVSQTHVDLINRFRENNIITEDAVYNLMIQVDFGIFYTDVRDEWVEHNAVIIERTIPYLKRGFRVLLCPLNLYYAVVLAILVGEEGGVVSFGHYGNVHTLAQAGLGWMVEDYRLRFTNNRYELFYGKPSYDQFLIGGFPKGAPYDMIIMTDEPLTDAVFKQLKDDGVIIRPDLEEYILHPPQLIPKSVTEPNTISDPTSVFDQH